MTCHEFSKEFISRFMDNDLEAEDHNAFSRHKVQCPDCCATKTHFRQAGMIFERQADAMAGQLLKNTHRIFIKTEAPGHNSGIYRIIKHKSRRTQAVLGMLSLAVVAVIISLAAPWHQGQRQPPVPGPSAVVNSVDAYGSPVVIIETVKNPPYNYLVF